jgi:hypothetical protein
LRVYKAVNLLRSLFLILERKGEEEGRGEERKGEEKGRGEEE